MQDVCALDGVHSRADGKEYIIELNDSAIGFNARHEEEDLQHIRDLVLLRMMQVQILHLFKDVLNPNNPTSLSGIPSS